VKFFDVLSSESAEIFKYYLINKLQKVDEV